jgi:spermidine synthase
VSDIDRDAGAWHGGRGDGILLLAAIFVLAICGLAYELIAGALSSYLLGDSVTQFSLVIGLFLTAMGVGSFLSRYVTGSLASWFVGIEIAIGVIGGATALVGFVMFAMTEFYLPTLFVLIVVVGALIGLEVPLMIRILRESSSLRVTVANVLSLDYAGALFASILFPFLLLPQLGLVRAGLCLGLMNVLVAAALTWRLGRLLGPHRRMLGIASAVAAVGLASGVALAGRMVEHLENRVYQDEIIFAKSTPYQRIVVTRWREDIRLFLNGHLQFSSVDEYRYHEALAHPAMCLADRRERVLILGGGDGLLAREVLNYDDVERVDLVDIDPAVTDLFRDNPMMARLNEGSLSDARVSIHNVDAMRFLEEADAFYDVVLMDLPDPSEPALGKLYSRAFFELVGRRLSSGGILASQCASPFRSKEAFWCIVHTMEAATWGAVERHGFKVRPYWAHVPTFGGWGFAVAAVDRSPDGAISLRTPTRFLTNSFVPTMFTLPADLAEVETPVSTLDRPEVVNLYRVGYHRYLE